MMNPSADPESKKWALLWIGKFLLFGSNRETLNISAGNLAKTKKKIAAREVEFRLFK